MRFSFKKSLVVAVACVMATGVLVPEVAGAANRNDLVSDQAEAKLKMSELKADLEGVSVELRNAAIKLQETRDQIPLAEAELAAAEAELSAAQREAEENAQLLKAAQSKLSSIQGTITTSESQAQSATDTLGELARAIYRGETTPTTVDLLMNSASARDFMTAYQVNKTLTRVQAEAVASYEQDAGKAKNQGARQEAVEARVQELKERADQLVIEQQTKQDAAQHKRDALSSLEATITEQSAVLESRKSEVQASIAQEQAEYDELAAQIAAIDEENRRAAAAAAALAAKAAKAAEAQSIPSGQSSSSSGSGFIQSPIRTSLYVTSRYGYRIHPISGVRKMHQGVDLASACGNPQYAAAPGTVTYVGWYGGGGNTVRINHGMYAGSSWQTVYMHFSSTKVKVGQSVDRNTVIGLTGTTGGSTGCHVHFEVWKNGATQNPLNYIG